jgi:acetoin utilization deacetylase AcuC-like enzyme
VLIVGGPLPSPEHHRVGHPERPGRVEAAMAGVDDLHLGSDLEFVTPRVATEAELARVHSAAYLRELAAFCEAGGGDLDPDTYATAASFEAAKTAAGTGLETIAAMGRRGGSVGLVVARPPGHHAVADRAMGFCLLNSVAVAAAALVTAGERVLIVDWDVHHGNGTQDIFWDERNVLYVSTHQWPLYPGTGAAREIGGRAALGLTVNVPLAPGTSGGTLARGLELLAAPVIDAFGPTWVLVSAGFDAHRDDLMADLALSSGDYAVLAKLVRGLVPSESRLALFLEGGYDLEAVRGSVRSTLGALLGTPYDAEAPTGDDLGAEVLPRVKAEREAAIRRAEHAVSGERGPL